MKRCLPLAAFLALGLALFTPAEAGATAKPQMVIVDTDIGDDIDDAFALALVLVDPRLKVIGVTTAWGDTHTRVLLVRRLLAALGRTDVKVAEGAATADPTPFTQRLWAMGAVDQSSAPDAVELIRAEAKAHPGEIALLALAPLTNVQALIRRDPEAVLRLKAVVMMGGSIHTGYQIGGAVPDPHPSAEYNIASAPEAFRLLLDSRAPIRMFPLDSTQLKFDEVRRDRLFAYGSRSSDALALLYHQWRLFNAWGQITPTLFDVVPTAWLIDPSLCPLQPLRIAVDDKGYTRPIEGPPNVEVCLSLHEDAAQRLIMDDLAPAR